VKQCCEPWDKIPNSGIFEAKFSHLGFFRPFGGKSGIYESVENTAKIYGFRGYFLNFDEKFRLRQAKIKKTTS
jgi:hypothetical protein